MMECEEEGEEGMAMVAVDDGQQQSQEQEQWARGQIETQAARRAFKTFVKGEIIQ